MSFLELSSVSKTYGRMVQAVKDLNLSVKKGEIVALLGSSGCGKTSTLRMIAGFESVTNGEIRVDGSTIHTLPPARRSVAMAFEGYSLYPPLTIRKNIAFAMNSEQLSTADIAKRVEEIARIVELEDVLDRYPSSISGGQQQRASLARALVRKANLHLLDEPMGQLEPQLRALLRGRIKHFIKDHNLTAILVTHDQTEANALADRIAVMEDGELQQFDTPAVLKENPANLFTATFIGEPPMNVFAARLSRADGHVIFGLQDGLALSFDEASFSPDLRDRLYLPGDSVTIGVRPHAVRLVPDGRTATVIVNQWLGDQTHVAANFAGGTVVSVAHDRAPIREGEQVGVSILPEDLHIFDSRSGIAISHGGQLA
ncbi:MAG: ABC transporter ATP-binding protein [Rhodobacteraceae bacterium]|nr:ABC transporter ATP-binding protein [Paracoccaceae bacterium]